MQYRAVVLDNRGHTAHERARGRAAVPAPLVTIEAPAEGSNVRGTVEVRAVADPERATHVVRVRAQRRRRAVDGDRHGHSSPAYTVFDDLAPLDLAPGTPIALPGDPAPSRTARPVDERGAHGPQAPGRR